MKTYIQPQTFTFEISSAEHLLTVSNPEGTQNLNITVDRNSSNSVNTSSGVWTRGKQGFGQGMWEDMK